MLYRSTGTASTERTHVCKPGTPSTRTVMVPMVAPLMMRSSMLELDAGSEPHAVIEPCASLLLGVGWQGRGPLRAGSHRRPHPTLFPPCLQDRVMAFFPAVVLQMFGEGGIRR